MRFYRYEPEVSGSYGPNTVYVSKKTEAPIVVSHLHYEFNYWPEDDLQTRFFHFVGTERLKNAIEGLSPPVTGIGFGDVEISGDDQEFDRVWRKGRPDSALGKWYWFKISGKQGIDDFGCNENADLVVSERVLNVLRSLGAKYGEITEYSGEMAGPPNA
jgi:hypothetical protein